MSAPSSDIRSRGDVFAPKIETRITEETAHPANPYQADRVRFHGFDHLSLMEKLPFTDVVFLLLRGELPSAAEADVFRRLSIALINPGPRHPAGQAAIVAGVGKTNPGQLLPIALTLYGGEGDGAAEVEAAMRFYRKSQRKPVDAVLRTQGIDGLPGFGTLYGDPDPYAERLLHAFTGDSGTVVGWAKEMQVVARRSGIGVLRCGVCAAVLADLGFLPRQGVALMQLMAAPGLMAHGLEFANKPLTHMLFEPDSQYEIEDPA